MYYWQSFSQQAFFQALVVINWRFSRVPTAVQLL